MPLAPARRPSRTRRLPALALLATVALAARPAALPAQIAAGEYAARRDALLARLDSGAVIAFGGVEPVGHWPIFSQLPSFEYLTGFGEPDAVLLLVKRGGTDAATLFVPPRNLRAELWIGTRAGPADVAARTGMSGRPLGELRSVVDSLLGAGLPLHVVGDVQTEDFASADTLTLGARFVEGLRRERPGLVVHALDTVVHRMRARKSDAEVALLRRAVDITAAAHRDAMRAVEPGCAEGEIQALLEGTFRRLGGERPAYGSIVGSGPNALILHYQQNTRSMKAGELLLIDAGTAFGHYAADVTRTMPVSGRFTPEQRAVYEIVLAAQAAYVGAIRPDGPLAEAEAAGSAVVGAGLARLGLIEAPDAVFDGDSTTMRCPPGGCAQRALYAWHGYGGHGIGLDVHDPAQFYFAPHRFAPGDVFTVEPGIYVNPAILDQLPDTPRNRALVAKLRPVMRRYQDVGVRIEDDYLVTAGGVEWLSSGVPREIAEVEALMRERAPQLPGGGSCGRPVS